MFCVWFPNDAYHIFVQINPNAHVLPDIKELYATGFLQDNNIRFYVVLVFSNLNDINLTAQYAPDTMHKFSLPVITTENIILSIGISTKRKFAHKLYSYVNK